MRQVFHALVEQGHVERATLGLTPFAFNPAIAAALHLNAQTGILAEDVDPDGPADHAGLKPGDVLLSIDGHQASTIVQFASLLAALRPDVPVAVKILRGAQAQALQIKPALDETDPLPLTARINERNNLVRRLEILGVALDSEIEAMEGPTRYPHGVIVAARSSTLHISSDTIQVRDIIYQINGHPVSTVQELRQLLREVPAGEPLVLQVERDHNLLYIPLGPARE